MVPVFSELAAIVRTEQGLTIAGTRVTLYDVMDLLTDGCAPQLILNWLPLTPEQLEAALTYIAAHRAEVEADYQEVLAAAEEMQQYWRSRSREHDALIAAMSPRQENDRVSEFDRP